jgi:hypothetical protein
MASGSVSQIAGVHHLQMHPDPGVSDFVRKFFGETTVTASNQNAAVRGPVRSSSSIVTKCGSSNLGNAILVEDGIELWMLQNPHLGLHLQAAFNTVRSE